MKIRVAYIITPNFGSTWSGITHNMFSLISGWHDDDISLDLLGTKLKVLNNNSGERIYRLSGPIWQSPHHKMSSYQRLVWTLQIFWLYITQGRKYDIFHFISINWGGMLSPLILHPFGKKTVFSMIRYDYDNPSYMDRTFRGRRVVKLLRRFDGITGLAPAFIDDCKRHGFKNKMLVLPYFINHPKLEQGKNSVEGNALRSQLKIPLDAPVLLFVGSDHKRKGLDILVDAFIQLATKHSNLQLIILGPNKKDDHTSVDTSFLDSQRLKIEQAKLQEQVVWTGMIRDLDMIAQYYSSADIMVFPSRGEGLGIVLVEAMYAGLPIVVSNLEGITDSIIKHGENGLLVKANDTEGFVDSIDTLIQDLDLREYMGKNNHKKATEMLGFDQYCEKLRGFYVDIYNS